jgi:predicted RNA polymerase sigma factor
MDAAAAIDGRYRGSAELVVVIGSGTSTCRDAAAKSVVAVEAILGMERSHLWHAALADNLRRLGRAAEAAGELETAAALGPPRKNDGCFCPGSST